ncbi:MAG: hypothetical protein U0893_20740 [Chloroflexota bacterium]
MTVDPELYDPGFARWDADDALDALHMAGLDITHVEQARWPANAPQPRSHRQAFTFRSPGALDPHLLLVFDTLEDLKEWALWLARYWKARPYLSVHGNLLLLVSRDLPPGAALPFHLALETLGAVPEPPPAPEVAPAPVPPTTPTPDPASAQPEPAASAEGARG